MLQLAHKLGREKLIEQCRIARTRCKETEQLIAIRQATLTRAREHLGGQGQRSLCRQKEAKDGEGCKANAIANLSMPSSNSLDDSATHFHTHTSTPNFERLEQRRKSFAGLPSQKLVIPPPYGPYCPALRENISEIDEELFNEGLITEDLSVVTTDIPRSVLDSRAASAESRGGARCDIHTPKLGLEPPTAPKAKRRPFKKIMKRANSWQVGTESTKIFSGSSTVEEHLDGSDDR